MTIGSSSGTTTINNQLATANYTFPVADGVAGQVLVTDTDPIRMKQLFEGLTIEKKLFEIENGEITTLI